MGREDARRREDERNGSDSGGWMYNHGGPGWRAFWLNFRLRSTL